MGIKHSYTSGIADGGNSSLIKPSDWNADHVGGGLLLLESHTASNSATLDFGSFLSGYYDNYVFRLIGLVPSTNAVDFYIRLSVGGSIDTGSNYINNHYLQASSGNTTAVVTTGAFVVRNALEISNLAATGMSGNLDLFNPQSTSLGKRIGGSIRWRNTNGASINSIMDGYWTNSSSMVDGVRFQFSSGNIASGIIRVYGVEQ